VRPFALLLSLLLLWTLALAAQKASGFVLTSPAFGPGAAIPRVHTCDGADRSPALSWTGLPQGTRSLALVCDDPDAPVGTWDHWVLYNIPPDRQGLPEGIASGERLPDGSLHGLNSWKRTGYGGPCPPPGKPHRYFFRLYALDGPLALPPRATKAQLLDAMKGHVLGQAELMGTYGR